MFYKIQKIILYPFQIIALVLVYLYKSVISPILPKTCIHTPSCSTYTIAALKEHGLIFGLVLSAKRISRCTPFHKGKEDFVPLNIRGDKKWIF